MTIQCGRSLFGILSLYVNVNSFLVGIRKPLVAVVTLRAGYLDARYTSGLFGIRWTVFLLNFGFVISAY